MKTSTYFALLAEYETAEIPLAILCEKYFGITAPEACKRAARAALPVPAYRTGSQKSPWMVSAADLAAHIDDQRKTAAIEWQKRNAAVHA